MLFFSGSYLSFTNVRNLETKTISRLIETSRVPPTTLQSNVKVEIGLKYCLSEAEPYRWKQF